MQLDKSRREHLGPRLERPCSSLALLAYCVLLCGALLGLGVTRAS